MSARGSPSRACSVHTLHSLEDVVVYTRCPTAPLASPGFSSEEDSTLLVPYRIKRCSNNYDKKKTLHTLMHASGTLSDDIMSVWPVCEWPAAPTACSAPRWRAPLAWRWTTGSAAGEVRLLGSRRLAPLSLSLPARGNKRSQTADKKETFSLMSARNFQNIQLWRHLVILSSNDTHIRMFCKVLASVLPASSPI